MKNPIQPYLHFDGNCRDAMGFYKSLFGGELNLMPISESPQKQDFANELQNEIMHSSLVNGDFMIMASDMCGMGKLIQGNSVQLNLNCSSSEEIKDLYEKLSDGGKILNELREEFWGSTFAMVIDRFGVRWMLSYDKK